MKIDKFYNKHRYLFPENYNFIIEGIKIDKLNKKVSIDFSQENGVDTSIINNPTYYKIGNIDIISIFKRKSIIDEHNDGNPLLYALKSIHGWEIENFDIKLLMKQFIRICEKIDPVYDTIIKIPSHNELNNMFMDRLNKIIHAKDRINDTFMKLETSEVWDIGIDLKNVPEKDREELDKSFRKMGEFFTFKHVPPYLRRHIKKIYNDTYVGNELEDGDKINNKNILILDDTISSGTTISAYTREIEEMFDPKKITVITLFSRL